MRETNQYSIFSNIVFTTKAYWRYYKLSVICVVFGTFTKVLAPFVGIYLPKIVLDLLNEQVTPALFVQQVSLVILVVVVINALNGYAGYIIDWAGGLFGTFLFYDYEFNKKITIDYETLENPEFRIVENKARQAIATNLMAGCRMPEYLSNLIVNILGLLLYTTVIANVNPLLLLLLVMSAMINWIVLSFAQKYESNMRVLLA